MDLSQLAKATILDTHTGEQIPVMYNPEEYKLDQGNNFAEVGIPGTSAPPLQYVRGKARSLTMELFFDSYERGEDVRVHTGRLVRLLDQNPRTHAPPVLLFTMGQFAFQCVLTEVSQRFTMFTRDGTPVRATLSVTLQEFVRIDFEVQRGFFVGPPTLYNVAAGQTVSHVAAELLGDPTRWREIAEANGIDDPFNLPAGLPLVVPPGGAA